MSHSFVVDSSIALAWCFLDEATPATRKLLNRLDHDSILVPAWWYLELTNVLYLAERKGRVDAAKVAEYIALIESLNVGIDFEGHDRAFDHLLPLCRTCQLTSYDALYLDLALRSELPLATLDEPLRNAAKKLGVKLLGK